MRGTIYRIKSDLRSEKERVVPKKSTSKARASPLHRKKEAPPMRLMDRDMAILEDLLRYRVLNLEMIVRKYFKKKQGSETDNGLRSAAKRRLRLMFDHRLVNRHWLPTIETGRDPLVYTLGAQGARKLHERGEDPEAIERALRYEPRFKPLFAAHMLDLVRNVTVARGYDPREFVLFAYGGAGPVHAAISPPY